jgi:hypothetical protein
LRTARDPLADRIALAHLDPGTGDLAASRALAVELTPLIVPLLRRGAVLVSEPAVVSDELSPLEPPESVAPERYNIYRRVSRRSQA